MVTRVTRSEMTSFKLKITSPLWILVGNSLVTRYNQTFRSTSTKKCSDLHRIVLLGHPGPCQSMEWLNLGITTLKHTIYASNVF